MQTPYRWTKAEIDRECPLVEVRIDNDGIAGIYCGERVLFLACKSVTNGTLKKFIEVYRIAVKAGILKEKQ